MHIHQCRVKKSITGSLGRIHSVPFRLMSSSLFLFRHRRAIQKSRGSKVRRAEGTMESETGAPASTANSTGTTTTTTATTTTATTSSSSATSSSTTSASSSSSGSSATAATTSATSTGGSNSSNTSSTSSSSTATGRQAVPQISVYSGIPDRQTVQVSLMVLWCTMFCGALGDVCCQSSDVIKHLLCCPLLVQMRRHTCWLCACKLFFRDHFSKYKLFQEDSCIDLPGWCTDDGISNKRSIQRVCPSQRKECFWSITALDPVTHGEAYPQA